VFFIVVNLGQFGFNYVESIYVRVYEDRIDLLRAAIVGPAGTPYHDGLFFFDVRFPSEYPKCPPVHDHLTPSFPLIFLYCHRHP
jgi:ubiquitin-protein ligase